MTDEKHLEDIKRLLVLLLIKLDSTSEEIATALQVDSSAVRRMIPFRQIKRIVKTPES
jgi:transcription initiation factor IIE alpha subunit